MEVMKRTKAFIASLCDTLMFFIFKQPKPNQIQIPIPIPSPPQQPPAASAVAAATTEDYNTDLEKMPLEEALPKLGHNSNYSTPVPVIDWGKTILEFCLMTAIALFSVTSQTHLQLPPLFYVFWVLILIAFVSSLAGILFRMKLPSTAAVLELTAIVCMVLCFFMAMEMSIKSPDLKWVSRVICALSVFSSSIYWINNFHT